MNLEQRIATHASIDPRVTPADIEANIVHEIYFNAGQAARLLDASFALDQPLPDSARSLEVLTFCVLVLRNGFTVSGESACASPRNFSEKIGRDIARKNAVEKIWPLMGYELRQKLHDSGQ